jgi:hypothetical protein
MSALPSTFASFKPRSADGPVEMGKPVTSVIYMRPVPSHQPTPRGASLFTLPKEPEDARITGGTRSLDRRLLALNLSGSSFRSAETYKPEVA